jgi:outer membrane murein-binding lipoprotein Lpp
MTEQDLKNLLGVYQQKTHELFSQNIALEAKIATLSSLIEALTSKVNELTSNQKESQKTTRKIKNTPEEDFV